MTCGVSIYWTTPMLPKFHDNETGINITEVRCICQHNLPSDSEKAVTITYTVFSDIIKTQQSHIYYKRDPTVGFPVVDMHAKDLPRIEN